MYKRRFEVTSKRVEDDGWIRVFIWGASGPSNFCIPSDDEFYQVGESYLETRQGHGFCQTIKEGGERK